MTDMGACNTLSAIYWCLFQANTSLHHREWALKLQRCWSSRGAKSWLSRGIMHPSLYHWTPANDGELHFFCLKVAQEERQSHFVGRSCSAYEPSLHWKDVSWAQEAQHRRYKAQKRENYDTNIAAVVESCPSMHHSSSQAAISCHFIIISLNCCLRVSLLGVIMLVVSDRSCENTQAGFCKTYIGETKRTLKAILSDHKQTVKRDDLKNTISVHAQESQHSMDWEGYTVKRTVTNYW